MTRKLEIGVQSREVDELIEKYDRLSKAEQKIARDAVSAGSGMDRAHRQGKVSMDDMASSVFRGVTAYSMMQKVIDNAIESVRRLREERRREAELGGGVAGAFAQLGQLAPNNAEMRRMTAAATRTSLETGVGIDRAANLQFALESAGMSGDRGMFSSMFHIMDDAKPMIEAVDTLQKALGADRAGSARELANQTIAASQMSRSTIPEFASAMAAPAQFMVGTGVSVSEMQAALSVIASASGSMDKAGTQMRSFLALMGRRGIEVPSLAEAAQGIQAKGLSDAEFQQEIGGRMEAKAFLESFLVNAGEIERRRRVLDQAKAGTGTADDELNRRIAAVTSNGIVSTEIERQRALRKQELTSVAAGGVGEMERQAAEAEQAAADRSENFIRRQGRAAGRKVGGLFDPILEEPGLAAPGTVSGAGAGVGEALLRTGTFPGLGPLGALADAIAQLGKEIGELRNSRSKEVSDLTASNDKLADAISGGAPGAVPPNKLDGVD